MKSILLLFSIFIFANSCSKSNSNLDYIIVNASIVDVENDSLHQNKIIGISGYTIQFVDDVFKLSDYKADTLIMAENKFVMPGLWDNHIHFRGGDSLANANKKFLPLLLAHGITTVRDAGGDITPHVLEWRKQIENGELAGPRIFTSGPKLDGSRPSWEGSISVTNEKEVSAALDSLEELGVDYVKMYDGSLSKEAFYEIIRQAEERGMKTTGHMPLSADLPEAVELGLDGTEHLYYVLKAGSPEAKSLTEQNLGYRMIHPLIDSHDTTIANEAYRFLAEHEHFITPTLHVGKTLAEVLITDHQSDTMLAYIDDKIEATYAGRVNSAKRGGERYTRDRAKMIAQFNSMILPMHNAGVSILAGSDSGPFNSYVYPGISLHEELRLLVEAGLSPAEALATSIINGPKFFGLEDEYGSIEVGKKADLVMLNKNPLENIEHTREVYSVIAGGKFYSRERLNKMLTQIRD